LTKIVFLQVGRFILLLVQGVVLLFEAAAFTIIRRIFLARAEGLPFEEAIFIYVLNHRTIGRASLLQLRSAEQAVAVDLDLEVLAVPLQDARVRTHLDLLGKISHQ